MDIHLALEHVPPVSTLIGALALFLALLLISGFMSGAETALLGLSKLRRRQLVDEKHPRVLAVERLMEHPQRLLVTILIVNTAALVAATALVTALAYNVFGNVGVAGAAGALAFLTLTFGEVIPKAYAAANPERVSLAIAPTMVNIQRALWPIVIVYEWLTEGVFRRLGREGREVSQFRSEEEIKTMITMGTEEGILEEAEEEMLHSVIEFSETTAKEVMIPRIDMTAVPADSTLDQVRAEVLESGFSRIPVYEGSFDNVVGVLYVKDMLLHLVEKRPEVPVRKLMREPYFVPESKKLDDLLQEMRDKRVHMAIIVDEFGGTAGILTLEDVLEEIVGEIFDEYDLRQEPIRKLDEMTAVVDARTHVADVNDALDVDIPEGDGYDTVAGYIYHELGRLGKEGELVHGPGFDMVVEKVSNRRILRARFVKHAPNLQEQHESDVTVT